MKLSDKLNLEIKAAVAAVRQPRASVEVFWCDAGPHDERLHGPWGGDLAGIADLRKWLAQHGCDGRQVTIYCDGDYRDVVLHP